MGLAVVEQYSIKQTSVLYFNHTHVRVWRTQDFSPPNGQPSPELGQRRLRLDSVSFCFAHSYFQFLRHPDMSKVSVAAGCGGKFKTLSGEHLSELCLLWMGKASGTQ